MLYIKKFFHTAKATVSLCNFSLWLVGRAYPLCPLRSHIGAFGDRQGVIDLEAKIPDSGLDPRVAEQDLRSAQIAGTRLQIVVALIRRRECVPQISGSRLISPSQSRKSRASRGHQLRRSWPAPLNRYQFD